jgi:hypothetical protein
VLQLALVRCSLISTFLLLTLIAGVAGDLALPMATLSAAAASAWTSDAKEKLRVAWRGAKLVLNKVERCLDNTPAKAPIAVFNALIEIGNVRLLLGVFYCSLTYLLRPLLITMMILANILPRLARASKSWVLLLRRRYPRTQKSGSGRSPSTPHSNYVFAPSSLTACRKITVEEDILKEMLLRSTVVKILESEEDKKTIMDIFKRICAYTDDFQVCICMTVMLIFCSFYWSSSTL